MSLSKNMRFTTIRMCASLFLSGAAAFDALPANAALIDTVVVGNPGNAPDSTGFGNVASNYRIGRFEVTNAEYAEFLNIKATSDPLGLYSGNMASSGRGGVIRSGSSGSYVYTVKPNFDNKPVNYVSWYDAVRFANWLHNGQGSGDTETGAYILLGGTEIPANSSSITRNASATWFLPSEDEWYKAAYHDPTAQGGDSDDYWLYPTATNTAPAPATANSIGDINNPGANTANILRNADWNGQDGNVTTVGSAGSLSASPYGTFDQGGNVWEWNEAQFSGTRRVIRGGSWFEIPNVLSASSRDSAEGAFANSDVGFRVATTAIPEPNTALLLSIGAMGALVLRRGFRA